MANKYYDKKIKESTAMIHKITAALMKNLEQYKAAKAKGDDTSKFMKTSKQLIDAKKNWQKELDNQIMQVDRDVELAMEVKMTEGISGYDDPKFPKAKYKHLDKVMVDFTKDLARADVDQKAIEGVLTNMAVRMAKLHGTK